MDYRRLVPNSISATSLIFGVLSIFKSIEGDWFWAPVFIIFAVIADSMDGRAARMLGVSGDFGKELDSLCDLGSFGVAPAIMIYLYGMTELGFIGQIMAAFFTIGGAMRLARFNVNSGVVHGYFQGMPIPAGACFLATYVLSGFTFSAWLVALMTVTVAGILYSNVKFPDFKGKDNPLHKIPVLAALALGAVLLWQRPSAWLFVGMFVYTAAGMINYVYTLLLRKN